MEMAPITCFAERASLSAFSLWISAASFSRFSLACACGHRRGVPDSATDSATGAFCPTRATARGDHHRGERGSVEVGAAVRAPPARRRVRRPSSSQTAASPTPDGTWTGGVNPARPTSPASCSEAPRHPGISHTEVLGCGKGAGEGVRPRAAGSRRLERHLGLGAVAHHGVAGGQRDPDQQHQLTQQPHRAALSTPSPLRDTHWWCQGVGARLAGCGRLRTHMRLQRVQAELPFFLYLSSSLSPQLGELAGAALEAAPPPPSQPPPPPPPPPVFQESSPSIRPLAQCLSRASLLEYYPKMVATELSQIIPQNWKGQA